MAILEKIRKRTVFLIFVIGMSLFAFVISGVISKGVFHSQPSAIGVVNGEEIPMAAFRQQVEYVSRSMGQEASLTQAVNRVWNQDVRSKIFHQQFEKLGISIGKDQILSILAQNPQISQVPEFTNDKGFFDAQKFINYIASLKQSNPQAFMQWQAQEESIIEGAKQNIYFSLILSGLGATKTEGEVAYKQNMEKVNISYVTLPYSTVSDDQVTVTNSDIEQYIKNHKKNFEREAQRNVQYVVVSEQASVSDRDEIKSELEKLLQSKEEFNSATNSTDEVLGFGQTQDVRSFVEKYSDLPYDTLYVAKSDLPAADADKLFSLSKNEVYGPYEDAGYFKLTRLLDKKSDAQVRASHILIAYAGSKAATPKTTITKEEAEKKAKEILTQVKQENADFQALAQKYSDGPTAYRGGDLGYFQKGMMVPEFEKYVFSNPVGSIGLVETDFGFHIIKVTDKRDAVLLATVARKIEASEKTANEAYAKATKFEMQATENPKKFADVASGMDLDVRVANNLETNDEYIAGFGNLRALVQWAFKDAKVGDIKRFSTKQGYVVAQITRATDKGLISVADAAIYVKPIIEKEKKAEILAKRLLGSDLNTVAEKNAVQVLSADGIIASNPILTGVGREPKVIGVALSLAVDKLSKPITGENGVYVIKVTSKEEAPAITDYKSYLLTLKALKIRQAQGQVYDALYKASDIKDYRSDFY